MTVMLLIVDVAVSGHVLLIGSLGVSIMVRFLVQGYGYVLGAGYAMWVIKPVTSGFDVQVPATRSRC